MSPPLEMLVWTPRVWVGPGWDVTPRRAGASDRLGDLGRSHLAKCPHLVDVSVQSPSEDVFFMVLFYSWIRTTSAPGTLSRHQVQLPLASRFSFAWQKASGNARGGVPAPPVTTSVTLGQNTPPLRASVSSTVPKCCGRTHVMCSEQCLNSMAPISVTGFCFC